MKSKKVIAALLAFTLLAFISAGQASAAAKSYKDADHGFSFNYPETWELRRNNIGGVRVLAPKSVSAFANFSATVAPPWEEEQTTAEAIADGYRGGSEKVEILSHKKTKFNGAPCVAVDMSYTTINNPKQKIRQQVYFINHKGKGYLLVAGAFSQDYAKCEKSLKMMLDSFKF